MPDAVSALTFPEPKTSPKPRGRLKGTTKPKELGDDEPYAPPQRWTATNTDDSCIAQCLRNRKIATTSSPSKYPLSSDDASDEDEDSDPPVFRRDYSAFPSLPQNLPPARISKPNLDSYTDVYVDGACYENGGSSPRPRWRNG